MNRRGVTLIEVLITIVIGAIAFFAAAMPFIAERSFWGSGNRQTEAQRDAQMAVRAMARVARQSTSYAVAGGGNQIAFTAPGGGAPSCFRGGPAFGNQLQRYATQTCTGTATVLIDGNQSRVTSLVVTAVASNLVRVEVQVTRQLAGHIPQDAVLATNLFLRNAS